MRTCLITSHENMPRVSGGEICGAAVWNPHLPPQIPRPSVNLVFEFGANDLTVKKASQGESWLSGETQETAGFSKKKEKDKKKVDIILRGDHWAVIHPRVTTPWVWWTSPRTLHVEHEGPPPTPNPDLCFSAPQHRFGSLPWWRGPTTVRFGGKPVIFPPTPLELWERKGQANPSGVLNFNRQDMSFLTEAPFSRT